jgi:hypothetical protein
MSTKKRTGCEIIFINFCLHFQAVSIASVLTDRTCILSNGTKNFRFSDHELIACSRGFTGWKNTNCSPSPHNQSLICQEKTLEGCDGGGVERAWRYLVNNSGGLVSGGPHNSEYVIRICNTGLNFDFDKTT